MIKWIPPPPVAEPPLEKPLIKRKIRVREGDWMVERVERDGAEGRSPTARKGDEKMDADG